MASRVYELCLNDGREDDGVPDHFKEESELLQHLEKIEETRGLSSGDRTVRVLSVEEGSTNSVGRLVGVVDAATVRKHGEVREEELSNPLT